MGGGSGGGDSYDAAYNARIATIMEEESARGGEALAWEQTYVRPYEQAMMAGNQQIMESNLSLLPQQTANEKARLQGQAGLLSSVYSSLGKHDIGTAMNTATADMATAFGARDKENAMAMKGLGMTPNSSAFQANQNDMTKALGVASARTTARQNTEMRNLNEKIQGLQI